MYREVSIKRPVKEKFYFFFKKGWMVFLLQWTRERKDIYYVFRFARVLEGKKMRMK